MQGSVNWHVTLNMSVTDRISLSMLLIHHFGRSKYEEHFWNLVAPEVVQEKHFGNLVIPLQSWYKKSASETWSLPKYFDIKVIILLSFPKFSSTSYLLLLVAMILAGINMYGLACLNLFPYCSLWCLSSLSLLALTMVLCQTKFFLRTPVVDNFLAHNSQGIRRVCWVWYLFTCNSIVSVFKRLWWVTQFTRDVFKIGFTIYVHQMFIK